MCYGCLIFPVVFELIQPDCDYHAIIIVLSLLKSLMADQVAKFSSRVVKTTAIAGGNSSGSYGSGVVNEEYQVVLIYP